MKVIIIFSLVLLFVQQVFAQDIILKRNGEEIPAQVIEIGMDSILYQQPDSVESLQQSIAKADVLMVRFANGTQEVFEEPNAQNLAKAETTYSPEYMYEMGKNDARMLYKGNDAMWGSATCALLFPYGLVGSAAIGLTKPKAYKNPVSNISYLDNPDYVKGYEKQAHRRKAGKAVAGAGISTALVATVAVIIISTTLGMH